MLLLRVVRALATLFPCTSRRVQEGTQQHAGTAYSLTQTAGGKDEGYGTVARMLFVVVLMLPPGTVVQSIPSAARQAYAQAMADAPQFSRHIPDGAEFSKGSTALICCTILCNLLHAATN